jgi:hypothetical protein
MQSSLGSTSGTGIPHRWQQGLIETIFSKQVWQILVP